MSSKLSKLVTELHILGMDIEVRYPEDYPTIDGPDGDYKCVGLAHIDDGYIEICDNPNIKYDNKLRTLLHEVIEMINGNLELGLKHRQISQLETALFQVLRTNANFAKAFTLYKGGK